MGRIEIFLTQRSKERKGRKIFLCVLCFFALQIPASFSVSAQTSCHTDDEAIIDLHVPKLGVPVLWDAQYGLRAKDVELLAGVANADGTVTAAGRVTGKNAADSIVLVRLDRRGRAVSEQMTPAKSGERPVMMIASGDGTLLLSNFSGAQGIQARLAWFGADGVFKRDVMLSNPGFDYEGRMLIALPDGGFAIALNGVRPNRGAARFGIIMRFAASGAKQWQRSYTPGVANEIDGIGATGAHGLVAAGSIKLDDGRLAGWAMQVAENGAVMWEKTWPRGALGVLRRAGGTADGGAILAGEAGPGDGGPPALWLMRLNGHGEVLWERYLRDKTFAFSAVDARALPDGRMVVTANAKAVATGAGTRDHVRLLTISPRGEIMKDEAFIEGIGARAQGVTTGANGERVVTATIDADDHPLNIELVAAGGFHAVESKLTGKPQPAPQPQQKGWVFVAAPPASYSDPCAAHGG